MTKPMSQRIVNRYAMSNVPPEETGIDGIGIYISPGQCQGKSNRHGPRVKVYAGTRYRHTSILASVSISETPRVVQGELKPKQFKAVAKFILLNLEVLLQHWNCELSDREALNKLRSL